jgi:hypothetical protein
MMGENSSAEALTSINRSTTMATGVPIALTSSHRSSAPSMSNTLIFILNLYIT